MPEAETGWESSDDKSEEAENEQCEEDIKEEMETLPESNDKNRR